MRGETMKNKLQKNRYSTTFGVDPLYLPFIRIVMYQILRAAGSTTGSSPLYCLHLRFRKCLTYAYCLYYLKILEYHTGHCKRFFLFFALLFFIHSTIFDVERKIAGQFCTGIFRQGVFPPYGKIGWPQKYTKKAVSKETAFFLNGGQTRNRTRDTRIFSPPLYQLSYLAKYWSTHYTLFRTPCQLFFSNFFLSKGKFCFSRQRGGGKIK